LNGTPSSPSPIRRAGRPPRGQPFRLFCLPPAGAGASLFFPWLDAAPGDIEVCPVSLPGREDRLREPLAASIPALADELADALAPALDLPYVVLGYSMGALLGYELLRRWDARGLRQPDLFVALAARAPGVPFSREAPLHTLDRDAFRAALADLGGTPPELLANEDAMALFEPILRNDLRISEIYAGAAGWRMSCPLLAFHGRQDALLGESEVSAWRDCTSARFDLQVIDEPHMLRRPAFMQVLSTVAARWPRGLFG
jgi:surfactin synthase thioesterase subunit